MLIKFWNITYSHLGTQSLSSQFTAIYIYIYIHTHTHTHTIHRPIHRPHLTACGISVPGPGTESVPLVVKAWSSNQWTAREFSIAVDICKTESTIFIVFNIK